MFGVQVLQHVSQLADFAHGIVQLSLQALDHLMAVFPSGLRDRGANLVLALEAGEVLARRRDVVDGADDLADLLVVGVFALDFVFEVLLERLVLHLDVLDLKLQRGHLALLVVELGRHGRQLLPLVLLHLLHGLVNVFLLVVQLFVFVFKVYEAPAQTFDAEAVVVVDVLVVHHHLLQELGILPQVAKLTLPRVKSMLLLVDLLPQLLDGLLVFERSLVQLLESLVLLLALLLVLQDGLLVGRDARQDLLLPLNEGLLLFVELLGAGDDVLLLRGETLVDLSFLPFFLQEADGLERALALDDEGSDAGEVLVADLRVGVLAHVLIDPTEELLDLRLLVNVHLAFFSFCNENYNYNCSPTIIDLAPFKFCLLAQINL